MRSHLVFAALILIAAIATAQSLVQRAQHVARPRQNPFAHQPEAIAAGAKLFRQNCQSCHGRAGEGNGRRRTPPLRTPFVEEANPGTLFWILTNGSGSGSMPSFAHLPEPERWQLIAYLQREH